LRKTSASFTAVGLLFLTAAAGCSSGAAPSDRAQAAPTAKVEQAVQCTNCGDSTHTFAVGIRIGGGAICSGTLIAPNVVLTARHCVTTTPASIDCDTTNFPLGTYASSAFEVFTSQSIGGASAYLVRSGGVVVPSATRVCGNDIALLVLTANVPGNQFAEPVGQYPMTDHNRYSSTYTAIGYGFNGTSDSGTRRIKQNIDVTCIPGDPQIDCGDLTGKNLDAKEWAGGDGTCSGDSGSGAFEQTGFNQGKWITMGILSRGGVQNGNCVGSAYTRTDSWRQLIVQTVQQAATLGGYTPPAWTQPAPPQPDAGPGPGPDGGKPTGDGGGATDPKALGDPCAGNEECATGSCMALDGPSVCTQGCDDGANKCPSGFACKAGFCFAGSAPTTPAAAPTTTTTTSGCGVAPAAPDPGEPQPWRHLTLVGLGLAALVRRSRRRA
jgi:MYXO-CTERM domain-containing protein